MLKEKMIQFIKNNGRRYAKLSTKNTFKEIEKHLQDIKDERRTLLGHDDWYEDEILEQIEEYLEEIKPEIRKQDRNIKTAKMASLVSRKGTHKLPLDMEREVQSHLIEKGGMKKKSRKERNTRKNRATRKRRNQ